MVFCARCCRKSALLPGKVLQASGLESPLCCLEGNWPMTGLTTCSVKGTYGPCTTKGASAEPVTVKNLQKERRRLRAKHLWMDMKVIWDMLSNRMYTVAPTGMSSEQLEELLFNRATSTRRNPYEEKAYSGPRYHAVKWEQNQQWMEYYKHYCVPWLWMSVASLASSRARTRMPIPLFTPTWNIVLRGGKPGKARTSSNGVGSYLM